MPKKSLPDSEESESEAEVTYDVGKCIIVNLRVSGLKRVV